MINSIGSVSVRQFGLDKLDLVPAGQMEDIVRGAIGLATEGFFEGVADGPSPCTATATITRLLRQRRQPVRRAERRHALPGRPGRLLDRVHPGRAVPAGRPRADGCVDERGNFLLYRQIRPVDVPGLYFNGYNSSFFSPLNAEMAAVWIAADLAGAVPLPDVDGHAAGGRPSSWRSWTSRPAGTTAAARRSSRSRCTTSTRSSATSISTSARGVRASHWLNPINPAAYRRITPTLLKRLAARTTPPPQPTTAVPEGLVLPVPTEEPQVAGATRESEETRESAGTKASQLLS